MTTTRAEPLVRNAEHTSPSLLLLVLLGKWCLTTRRSGRLRTGWHRSVRWHPSGLPNGLGHLGEWNVSPARSSSDVDALLKIPTSFRVDEHCQQLTDRLVSIGVSSQRHVNLNPVAIATAFLVL